MLVRDQPDYAPAWSLLGQIECRCRAQRGSHTRRASRLRTTAVGEGCDHWPDPDYQSGNYLCLDGREGLALEQLAFSAQIPAGVTYGGLKLDPEWDALRSDRRFEKIVASLAPK